MRPTNWLKRIGDSGLVLPLRTSQQVNADSALTPTIVLEVCPTQSMHWLSFSGAGENALHLVGQ